VVSQVARGREDPEQHRVGRRHPDGRPARDRVLAEASEGPLPRALRELDPGLARQVAPRLAPEARGGDGEGQDQFQVGIFLAAGTRVVL